MRLQLHAKNPSICYKTENTYFQILLAQTQVKLFPKEVIQVNFKTSTCCNFIQKIRGISNLDFSLNLKNLILGQFCTLLASKPQYKIFFLENLHYLIVNLDDTLTSCKKSKKLNKLFQRKSLDK